MTATKKPIKKQIQIVTANKSRVYGSLDNYNKGRVITGQTKFPLIANQYMEEFFGKGYRAHVTYNESEDLVEVALKPACNKLVIESTKTDFPDSGGITIPGAKYERKPAELTLPELGIVKVKKGKIYDERVKPYLERLKKDKEDFGYTDISGFRYVKIITDKAVTDKIKIMLPKKAKWFKKKQTTSDQPAPSAEPVNAEIIVEAVEEPKAENPAGTTTPKTEAKK